MRFISVRIIVPFRPAGAEPSAEYTENSRNRQLFREIPDLFFPRKTPILERPEKPGRPYGTERSPRIRRNGRKRLTHISHETMKRFVWMLLLLPIGLQAQVRTERLLEKGWRFTRRRRPGIRRTVVRRLPVAGGDRTARLGHLRSVQRRKRSPAHGHRTGRPDAGRGTRRTDPEGCPSSARAGTGSASKCRNGTKAAGARSSSTAR